MQIVRQILVILVALNTVASTLAVPLIFMDYAARQDYISTVLCINKDKPMLNCDGKCYLAQKLKAAQEQQEEENQINFKSGVSFYAYQSGYDLPNNLASDIVTDYHVKKSNGKVSASIASIFKPPRV
ncbi:MAG: hypothetical protein OCD76_14200 [Reichenbachiella sp.]